MNWIKKNKLTFALIVVVLFLLVREYFPIYRILSPLRQTTLRDWTGVGFMETAPPSLSKIGGYVPPSPEYPPVESEERLVVEQSSMSMVVLNVREAVDKIIDRAKQSGGFMVSSSLTHPEEAPYATLVVRVPSDRFKEVLDYFRGLAIKVSSENILGTDVTAEYVDIKARIETLEKTKAKFEEILEKATNVQEILQVQREIINLQTQIDSLKGRERYLEQTAKLAKITIYLSTDELALPYAPAKPFRPQVIFKLATRSLIRTLRIVVTAIIWIVVYSVVWLPIILIIFFFRKWQRKKEFKT